LGMAQNPSVLGLLLQRLVPRLALRDVVTGRLSSVLLALPPTCPVRLAHLQPLLVEVAFLMLGLRDHSGPTQVDFLLVQARLLDSIRSDPCLL